MKEIVIDKSEEGIKLSKYVKKIFNGMPDSLIYKLLRKNYFKINDKRAKGEEILHNADKLSIFLGEDTFNKYFKSDLDLDKRKKDLSHEKFAYDRYIIYEDDNVIIFDKKEGLLSQGDKSNDISVDSLLKSYVGNGSIVNRLDRNTRGIIIFAKTYIAKNELSTAMHDRTIGKYYRAIVNGVVKKDKEELVHLYKKDEEKNIAIIKDINEKNKISDDFKEVRLIYKVIQRYDDRTILDIELLTGKSHQIRAQLAYIGHPIICDKKYMDAKLYDENKKTYSRKSQDLCCYKIIFPEFENVSLKKISSKVFEIKDLR